MRHPLERELAAIRRRLRARIALHAMSRIVGCLVGLVLVLAVADCLIRFQDLGIRLLVSLAALVAVLWTAYRYAYRPSIRVPSAVALARWIECREPRLGNRFSSSLEFLRRSEDDPTAGSAALRRAVIAQSTAEITALRPSEVVDWQAAARPTVWAIAVCLLAGAVAATDLRSARIALTRLANPWSQTAWPRKHRLVFTKAPTRIAAGQPFEVELIDGNGLLPDQVRIHYRRLSVGQTMQHAEPMRRDGAKMTARQEEVRQPFQYRAEGGDDDTMPWIELQVVEPPRVDALQVMLYPPPYTGWAPVPSEPRIDALQGTRAEIRGRATKPLRCATLVMSDGRRIPARLANDGHGFIVPAEQLKIDQSATYWFVLEDAERIEGGQEQRWEIRAERDMPPRVSIEQPDADLFVTAEATVVLRIVVEDELAVRDVALVATRSDRRGQPELTIPVFQAPPRAAPMADAGVTAPLAVQGPGHDDATEQQHKRNDVPHAARANSADKSQRMTLDYVWQLQSLALAPDTEILLEAQAHDFLPQVGKSAAPCRIHILTADGFAQRIAQQQQQLLDDLQRAVQLERETHDQTATVERRLRLADAIDPVDLDRLQSAELNQRQVSRILIGRGHGVARRAAALQRAVVNSRLHQLAVERRLQALIGALDQLEDRHLPTSQRALAGARKLAQVRLEDRPAGSDLSAAAARLAEAGRHQQQVIGVLEKLVGDLSQSLSYQCFERAIGQVRREQDRIRTATQSLVEETLTYQRSELTAEQQAALDVLAQSQADLARKLNQVEREMEAAGADLRERDRVSSARLAAAVQTARQLAISGRMQTAGHCIGHNQVGQAMVEQEAVARDLATLSDQLDSQLPKDLRQLPALAQELSARQRLVLDETRRLDGRPVPRQNAAAGAELPVAQLAQEQASLCDVTRSWADSMGRAPVLQTVLRWAAQPMARGAQLLSAQQTGAPTQEALSEAHERLVQLCDALRPSAGADPGTDPSAGAGRVRRAGDPQAVPRIAQLRLLAALQETVQRKTQALSDAFEQTAPTADQRRAINGLAIQQGELADLVVRLLAPAAQEFTEDSAKDDQ